MSTHFTPHSDPHHPRERTSLCGVRCIAGSARDGKQNGSSAIENVDCPKCIAAEKQPSLFGASR